MILRDGIRCHPKILAAGPEAAWLWVAAIDYSRSVLSDGFVPDAALRTLIPAPANKVRRLVDRLFDLKLFDRAAGGILIHDYLDHNDTREEVEAKKTGAKTRKARQRSRQRQEAVTPVSQRDMSVTLARARGVGVGVRTQPPKEAADPSTEIPEGGVGETAPGPPPETTAPADLWQAWVEAAAAHGVPASLTCAPRDYQHVQAVLALMPLADARRALAEFWRSPRWESYRHFGMFAANAGQLLAHANSGRREPFGLKPPPTAADPPRPRLKTAAEIRAAQAAGIVEARR